GARVPRPAKGGGAGGGAPPPPPPPPRGGDPPPLSAATMTTREVTPYAGALRKWEALCVRIAASGAPVPPDLVHGLLAHLFDLLAVVRDEELIDGFPGRIHLLLVPPPLGHRRGRDQP